MKIQPFIFLMAVSAMFFAADWPHWRGGDYTSISKEKGWFKRKTAKHLWKTNVGKGYAAVSIADGRAYTLGNAGALDTIYCFDAKTGKVIWTKKYKCVSGSYPGSRSTPAIEKGKVYSMSRAGDLFCLDAKTGKEIWSVHIAKKFGIRPPGWGLASSPLLYKNLILINVGQYGLALKKTTGDKVWFSGKAKSGYATPTLFKSGRRILAAMFAANSLVVVDVLSGRKQWSYAWKTAYDVNAADPEVIGSSIYISSGYGKGGALVSGKGVKRYFNKNIRSHFGSMVVYQGYIYGVDGQAGSRSNGLVCMNAATGKKVWAFDTGFGAHIMADEKIIFLSNNGDLIVADASPRAYTERSRTRRVLSRNCWTMPTLANGRIYCRNHKGDVVCVTYK